MNAQQPNHREKVQARLAAGDLTVGECMSSPVITCRPEDTLAAVQELGERHRIHHFPVVDRSGRFVGLLSQSDLLRHSPPLQQRLTFEQRQDFLKALRVLDAMREELTGDIRTTTPDSPLRSAAQLLLEQRIGCLPVLSRSGELVGILTRLDFVRFFADGV